MDVDPLTGISAKALADGYAFAEGWDHSELLEKFLALPEPDNPDAAWLGFCRSMGAHESVKAKRFRSSVTPEQLAAVPSPLEPAIVKQGDVSWVPWIDVLLARGARKLVEQIELARAMDAPHRWPQPNCKMPTPAKREKVAA